MIQTTGEFSLLIGLTWLQCFVIINRKPMINICIVFCFTLRTKNSWLPLKHHQSDVYRHRYDVCRDNALFSIGSLLLIGWNCPWFKREEIVGLGSAQIQTFVRLFNFVFVFFACYSLLSLIMAWVNLMTDRKQINHWSRVAFCNVCHVAFTQTFFYRLYFVL